MIDTERRRSLEEASAVISLKRGSKFYLTHPKNGTSSFVFTGTNGSVTLSYQETIGGYDKMRVAVVRGRWHYEDSSGRKRKIGKGGYIYVKRDDFSRWSDNY